MKASVINHKSCVGPWTTKINCLHLRNKWRKEEKNKNSVISVSLWPLFACQLVSVLSVHSSVGFFCLFHVLHSNGHPIWWKLKQNENFWWTKINESNLHVLHILCLFHKNRRKKLNERETKKTILLIVLHAIRFAF